MSTKAEDQAFQVQQVVAVACAIFRTNGYVKKSETFGKDIKSNSQLIYSHFFTPAEWSADVSESDNVLAKEIIDYLQGLSFKTMERSLTAFESNVLKFVTSTSIDKSGLGIAASLPSVYQNKLMQDEWEIRESQLADTSEFLGTVRTRCEFDATIENTRYIARTESYLICASVDNKSILKFFAQERLGEPGTKVCLTGFVKSHSESNYHGGKETMINRVKIAAVGEGLS